MRTLTLPETYAWQSPPGSSVQVSSSLGGGVARWDVSLFFLFAPSCSSPVVYLTLVCCFLLFLLSSVSGFLSLPSSFCLGSFRLLCCWGSFPSSFLCFPCHSAFLYCLGAFRPYCRSGCLFPLGPFGFRASSFVSGLFLWARLWRSCLSSRLACFAIGLFLSLLVPGSSFLFFSFSLRLGLLVPSFAPLAR